MSTLISRKLLEQRSEIDGQPFFQAGSMKAMIDMYATDDREVFVDGDRLEIGIRRLGTLNRQV